MLKVYVISLASHWQQLK